MKKINIFTIFMLMSGICSAQTINYVDVNGVTKLYIRTGTSTPESTPGTLQFKSSTYSVSEDGSAIRVYVSRASGSDGAASVNYATANGTAIADTDYNAASGTLNWIDGNADDKYFDVTIIDNNTVGSSRNFTAGLSSASGASLGSTTSTTITITEDDTVSLDYDPNWPYGIGIPTPPFGIDETYRMYDDVNNQNSELTYYESPSGGYYTHYIDPDYAGATNTSNTFGKLPKDGGVPRTTVPMNLPPGSVVEIHNRSLANAFGDLYATGVGTEQYPIFIRGVGEVAAAALNLNIGYGYDASYIIIENLNPARGRIGSPSTKNNHHLVVRDCNFAGTQAGLTSGGIGTYGNSTYPLNNVVIYNCDIHDTGDTWNPLTVVGDPDQHGIGVGAYENYIWIIDNTIYHCKGDGVQINGGVNDRTHHIYVGGNTIHHNLQSAAWAKQSTDVIFSQNITYGFRNQYNKPGNGGIALGMQYAPERVWFLFNRVYDTESGITFGSNSGGIGQDTYLIGNVIYDVAFDPEYHANGWEDYNPGTAWAQAGMRLSGGKNLYIFYNTFYNCIAGLNLPANITYYIGNNIFSNITGTQGENHVWVEDGTGTTLWDVSNNLFYQSSGDVRIRHYNTVYNTTTLPSENSTGNVTGNPLFVNADANDFDLQSESPFKSIEESSAIQTVIDRFNTLYGIDISDEVRSLRTTGVQQAP